MPHMQLDYLNSSPTNKAGLHVNASKSTRKYDIQLLVAVITVEPADKISFVYNCMQTRLRSQYNGK